MPKNDGQGQESSKEADAKKTSEADSSKATDTEALKAKESEELDLDESDLTDVDESQKVPYARFKQVNDKVKERDRAIETYKAQTQAQMQNLVAELEALRSIKSQNVQTQDDSGILDLDQMDPGQKVIQNLVKEIHALKGQVTNLSNKTSQESLKFKVDEAIKKFPKADKLAVMGIMKYDPALDIEEVAESLHQKVMAERTEGIKELIERKKKKAAAGTLPLSETGMVRLKESEKPKSVKEASERLKSFMSKLSF